MTSLKRHFLKNVPIRFVKSCRKDLTNFVQKDLTKNHKIFGGDKLMSDMVGTKSFVPLSWAFSSYSRYQGGGNIYPPSAARVI